MNNFLINWNIFGDEPDQEPLAFDSWDSAIEYLTDHITFMVEDDSSLYTEGVAAIRTLSVALPPASITVVVGPFVMYIMSSIEVSI